MPKEMLDGLDDQIALLREVASYGDLPYWDLTDAIEVVYQRVWTHAAAGYCFDGAANGEQGVDAVLNNLAAARDTWRKVLDLVVAEVGVEELFFRYIRP